MAPSVTPARRSRDEEESEEEEFDVSVDGEESPRSNSSKRRRLDDSDDEVSEESESDVLPDSFRRSPKGKQRQVNGLTNGHVNGDGPHEYHPGSIVRVTLTDFVTYTKAEFHPGPNLNMIIGPNGTGKSTLVCAICLGLGWATSHLGRAKDLGEFVKHGAKRASVEIELAADPVRHIQNPVITTKITKEGNKAEYTINGKKSNKKGVQELARSFSIQVDNLCQFLPQDRVVEFAALSPVDLLTQTQRAAAPQYMSEWHDQLKNMRKGQKQEQMEQQKTMDTLKNMENRQRLQEADVVRLRERSGLMERIAALEKLRPFPAYKEARVKHTEAKERRKAAQKELTRLQRRLEPNLQAVKDKEEYLMQINKVTTSRSNLVTRSQQTVEDNKKKLDGVQEKIEECAQQIQAEKDSSKETRQSIPKLNQHINNVQRARQNPPEEFDAAGMNEQIREKTRQIREIDGRIETIRDEVGSLGEQMKQRQRIGENATKEKENLHSQAGQQASKLRQASKDASKAWEWIQANRDKFEGEVYGPPIVSCSVKDPRHASAVESMIPDGDKLAFTVTSQRDFKKLQQHLYSEMKLTDINIRTVLHPLSAFKPPVTSEELRGLGLECWLIDLMEGPEPVLTMLCDNRNIHQTGFTSRDVSEQQFNTLQQSAVSSWVTPSQSYMISRRREYGPQATSTRVQALRPARFFTDMPVDWQMEQELDARIREARGEFDELNESKKALMAESEQMKEEKAAISSEQKAIEQDKQRKQKALSEFNGLEVKERALREKLEEAKKKISGSKDRVRAIIDHGDQYGLEKGQLALDYANSIKALEGLHVQLFEIEILQIEAKSDFDQHRAQHAEEERLLAERQAEVEQLRQEQDRRLADGNRLGDVCRNLGGTFTDLENEVYQELEDWTPEQLETEVQSTQARLEMTSGGGNENLIREYEKREKEIEKMRAKLNELESKLEEIEAKITDVRQKWEPELDQLIGKISEAFAENFAKIQCAGEVAVHKDDDFEDWSIQIKVKFRENEQLSVLDSHRQSGGERAVSTIFYLMALQSLARAPFRVVDEINQGMDPRNERLVHSRMVDIACAEHTSQYFLITPKLLNGLKYHPNMKVHCIASGEYMPEDHRELDFGMLAKRALALRGAGGVASAA